MEIGQEVFSERFGVGSIIDIKPDTYLVKFIKKSRELHNGGGLCNELMCWWFYKNTELNDDYGYGQIYSIE